MEKRLVFALTLSMLVLLLAVPSTSQAEIALMDGKLILSGFVKNTTYYRLNGYDREFDKSSGVSNHDTRFDFSNFSALIEILYTIKEDQESTLRIFSSFKGWYEAATRYDDNLHRHMNREDRREYQYPDRFEEDMIAEMYIDYTTGPWQVRVGKQIVIWGQLDINRVADVVNPLDLRWGVPGVDTWEEVKQGLWMIRTFYQSQLPGNLLFEFILNPGDYRSIELPYEGTHWGPFWFKQNPFPANRDRGYWSWMTAKWEDDEPSRFALDNIEWGGRIQGFTYNIDWAFIYWNALSDGASSADAGRAVQHAGIYFDTIGFLGGGPTQPRQPKWTVYKYKRYQTIGGTAQTFTTFVKDTVWRLEWFLEIGSPLVKGIDGNTAGIYKATRRNILGVALQANWYWTIPWFTRAVGKGQQMQTALTYFSERVFSYDNDLCLADRFHGPGESTADSVSLFIMQQMFNASWTFIFIGSYYTRIEKWMAVPSFTYMFADSGPFSGFRFDIGLKLYGGPKYHYSAINALSRDTNQRDSVILRLRYEF